MHSRRKFLGGLFGGIGLALLAPKAAIRVLEQTGQVLPRLDIQWHRVSSQLYRKTEQELLAYRLPLSQLLQRHAGPQQNTQTGQEDA
jgi:predicted sugar kinase